jgi:hypothetical protein
MSAFQKSLWDTSAHTVRFERAGNDILALSPEYNGTVLLTFDKTP